ncbi:hypothetical protein PMKS-001932 [Pichia membranifaciens]|uniref:Uncharacterized protein n=1 Tax=Pichia membranifaciens TaxID=4926 RepID=A0A1Q2YG54_9ASCO|nr:hypothetical protein PMKS-001932 [Pichia membranifaciens]
MDLRRAGGGKMRLERPHGLLLRGAVVVSVDLEDVNIGAETLGGGCDGVEDVFAGQAAGIDELHVVWVLIGKAVDGEARGVCVDGVVALGEDHDCVAGDAVLLEELPDELFGNAVGIHVCGVVGAQSEVIAAFENLHDLVFIFEDPIAVLCFGAETHAPNDDLGYFDSGLAEVDKLHVAGCSNGGGNF